MRPALYTKKYHDALGLAGLLVLPTIGVAQTAPADSTFTLGTVEVIGQREPAAIAQTTSVVDAETLAAQHRDDLAEALDLIPGVSVQNLGQRRERLISVRGFSSRQVPLFIDGIPVYVPYDGNVDLARFGVDYVSEIIVSKGLTSLLYGPNILGGAVNVVSRKPTLPFQLSTRLATEADDHLDGIERRAVLSLGGTRGNWYGYISGSYVRSDGYRLPDDFVPVPAEDGGMRESAESRDAVISAKLGYTPNESNEFALTYYRQDGDKLDPPYAGSYRRTNTRTDGVQVRFWTWPYWDKESIYFSARNGVGSKGVLRWRLFHDSFRNALESFDDATYTTQTRPYAFHGSNYDDYTYGGNADFQWTWNGAHTTRLAAHYRQDVHRESQIAPAMPLQRMEIPTYYAALEHEWRLSDSLTISPGYAYMIQPAETVQVYNSDPGIFSPVHTERSTAHNAQLVGTYKLGDAGSLIAGVSRKTRFPTLKERFSGGLGTAIPNPGLKPEAALHYEQRNRGVELSMDYAPLATLRLSGQVVFVDVDNLSAPEVHPTNIPEEKYLLAADWQFLQKWRLRVNAQHEAERFSNSTGTRVAQSFTLANAFVRFTPIDAIGIEFGVRNLTDELYAYEEGFFEAGRTWLGQIDYRF